MRALSEAALRAEFKAVIAGAGNLRAWIFANGFSKSDYSNFWAMMAGKIPFGGKVLEALGYRRVVIVTYVRIGEPLELPEGFEERAEHRADARYKPHARDIIRVSGSGPKKKPA